ncbi:hypothetical protein GIB67_013158 [Kingdonia uniflora]|uniref:Uncharacterized protein n=1 Tax=Kingdonia uniflora TaxID=39325 RepID=A0A7J7LCV5_9MAGN|nr:hypothetical protein GIB67_013158 [Kingdonia uniflora]
MDSNTTAGNYTLGTVAEAMKRKHNSNALVAKSEVYLIAYTKRDNTVQCHELAEKIMAIERLELHLKFASVDDSLTKHKDRGVARGEVVPVDPDTLIHNVLLGDGFYKIILSKVMKPRTPLSKDDGYSEDLGKVFFNFANGAIWLHCQSQARIKEDGEGQVFMELTPIWG